MELIDFEKNIELTNLEWSLEYEGLDCGYFIKNEDGIEYTVLKEAVENNDWEVLKNILTSKREPRMLRHMTRIVGYYSQVGNWNKSKLGELKARHKGNYSVPKK